MHSARPATVLIRLARLRHRRAEPPTVHRITNAPVALHDDQRVRVRNYVVSMSLRIVFIVLVVLTHGPWRWGFAIAAVVIPYFAVVIANGGRERTSRASTLIDARPALPPASAGSPPPTSRAG